MSSWANVATIGKAKNLKGGLLVYPREGLPFLLEEGMSVTFVPPVLRTPRTGRVESISAQPSGAYLVCFDTIDSIELAERLQDHSCLVRKSDLPDDFDHGLHDLVGFTLLDPKAVLIGRIVALEENPAHPLLVVEHNTASLKDTLDASSDQNATLVRVPLVEDFIVSLDDATKVLVMDLPEGLFDL
jgi:16S rRNA processing protein RimM